MLLKLVLRLKFLCFEGLTREVPLSRPSKVKIGGRECRHTEAHTSLAVALRFCRPDRTWQRAEVRLPLAGGLGPGRSNIPRVRYPQSTIGRPCEPGAGRRADPLAASPTESGKSREAKLTTAVWQIISLENEPGILVPKSWNPKLRSAFCVRHLHRKRLSGASAEAVYEVCWCCGCGFGIRFAEKPSDLELVSAES
jgi:hypothetical protein